MIWWNPHNQHIFLSDIFVIFIMLDDHCISLIHYHFFSFFFQVLDIRAFHMDIFHFFRASIYWFYFVLMVIKFSNFTKISTIFQLIIFRNSFFRSGGRIKEPRVSRMLAWTRIFLLISGIPSFLLYSPLIPIVYPVSDLFFSSNNSSLYELVRWSKDNQKKCVKC